MTGKNSQKMNISDMMAEEQAKLGYMKEAVRLYYPLSSLCNILECKTDIKGMNDVLAGFSSYMEEKYVSIHCRWNYLLYVDITFSIIISIAKRSETTCAYTLAQL